METVKGVETIEGMQSLDECRASIKQLAERINDDISSTVINDARIKSMRVLLDLFEEYNNEIK